MMDLNIKVLSFQHRNIFLIGWLPKTWKSQFSLIISEELVSRTILLFIQQLKT